jgi:hypothetical protein
MRMPCRGGCLCGAARFVCVAEPVHTFFCHCLDCQKETGGPFAAEIYVPAAAVALEGVLLTYTRTGDSGKAVHRRFCGFCGTVVVTAFEAVPGHICLKAGCLDDPSELKPQFHLYVSSKQPWDLITDGLPQFDKDF